MDRDQQSLIMDDLYNKLTKDGCTGMCPECDRYQNPCLGIDEYKIEVED